jgi:hypothetical protein
LFAALQAGPGDAVARMDATVAALRAHEAEAGEAEGAYMGLGAGESGPGDTWTGEHEACSQAGRAPRGRWATMGRGYALLRRLGWREGEGLGRDRGGRARALEPAKRAKGGLA